MMCDTLSASFASLRSQPEAEEATGIAGASVIDKSTDNPAKQLKRAFEAEKTIGPWMWRAWSSVALSRKGRISLVQLSTPSRCFLVDVLGSERDDPVVCWLRAVLEDDSVLKIIHDCRMDSDALEHRLGISLVNVHDTSCWHAALGYADKNLNDTLAYHGLPRNDARDGSVCRAGGTCAGFAPCWLHLTRLHVAETKQLPGKLR